jgi:hypothetical protein
MNTSPADPRARPEPSKHTPIRSISGAEQVVTDLSPCHLARLPATTPGNYARLVMTPQDALNPSQERSVHHIPGIPC